MKNLNHIELFAGCGGMSLGLESAGFELYFANELSPMASETFAYNILNEDLNSKSINKKIPSKTLWIKSQFPATDLTERLKENPFEARNGKYTDIKNDTDLKGKLLVGDINQLLEFLEKNKNASTELRKQNIDLLSGGPPCQGFSLAGKREKDDYKNLLPLSFAKISGLIKPKVVLLENVKGITSPFTVEGHQYHAWLEVSKAFVLEGFVPVCMMLNSKYFEVAQNRPRFILFAFRKDVFDKIKIAYKDNELLLTSETFYRTVNKHKTNIDVITKKDFKFYDIESQPELFDGNILPKIITKKEQFVTAKDAINDLRRTNIKYFASKIKNAYGSNLNIIFENKWTDGDYRVMNHDPRNHSSSVKARFRFYQVINEFKNGLKKGATDLFAGKDISEDILRKLFVEFSKYELLFINDEQEVYKKPSTIVEVEELVKSIPTKKHSQRALNDLEPAPAQLTIPDDICHYDPESLRTMTVREMARFQSFPDWFEFRSKVTTGGKMRKFQVPQYTQVGNAVPPLLAKALGETIIKLLKNIN
jgi:DNA (cytosine-5)-methyltransferase 1